MKLNKMTKEELEMLSYGKIAEMYLTENKVMLPTADLFKKVCDLLQLSEAEYQNKITDFFETLTTSKEFILLNDGKWDLRANHKVKIDIDEIYEEKDDEVIEHSDEDEETTIEDEDDFDVREEANYDDDLDDLTIVTEDELNEEK